MKACEDRGVVCVDNVPLSVIPDMLQALASGNVAKVAICSDVRTQPFDAALLLAQIALLRQRYECHVIFLRCHEKVLVARYNATKHRHPLYLQGFCVEENIRAEQQMLADVLLASDSVIDTSNYTSHQLKRHIQQMVDSKGEETAIHVMSFSYSYGVPLNADMVLDVRFLRNPYYDAALQALTGRNGAVAEYILDDPHAEWFIAHTQEMLERLLPLYQNEGKSYFTLAFGCTGGKHRSVFLAETLYHFLCEKGYSPTLHHRELNHIM